MAKVHTIGKTEIRVYANDHLPPHFHVVHPDFEALIVIDGLQHLCRFPERVDRQGRHGMGASQCFNHQS